MTFGIFRRRAAARRAAGGKSLLFYISEMYAMPEDVTTRRVAHGRKGLVQDANRIKGYFRHAVKQLDAEIANH